MTKLRFNYRWAVAVIAVAAMALSQSFYPATSTRALARAAATDLTGAVFMLTGAGPAATNRASSLPDLRSDLSTELRTVETYHDDLVTYFNQCAELNKKTSVSRTEIDSLQSKSDSLKSRLPGVQNAISAVMRKLKAANAWDDLDQKLLESTTDSRLLAFFQESSFKRDLEEAAASLGSHANEISAPLDKLRQKLTARTFSPDNGRSFVRVASARAFSPDGGVYLVRAAYRPLPPMTYVSMSCTLGQLRTRLIHRLGGNATDATNHNTFCACHPDKSTDYDGVACPSNAS